MTFTGKQNAAFDRMKDFFGGSIVLGIHGISKATNRHYVVSPARRNGEPAEAWNRPATSTDLIACREANSRGQDVFCRPTDELEAFYILIDDIPTSYIEAEYDKPGRLLIASSHEGRQMWLKCNRPLNREEKIFIAENFYAGCDNAAARAPGHRNGRMPCFFNRKEKYAPNFPVASIVWQTQGFYEVPEISEADQAPLKPKVSTMPLVQISADYKFKANLPRRADYSKGQDDSVTDFCFCLALARRKVDRDEIASMLFAERTTWAKKGDAENIQRYITKTIDKAVELVNR